MDLDGKEIKAVEKLVKAINIAVEQSPIVATNIAELRQMGFEPTLNIKLEIGLQEILHAAEDFSEAGGELRLTDDDLRVLRRMKIKI